LPPWIPFSYVLRGVVGNEGRGISKGLSLKPNGCPAALRGQFRIMAMAGYWDRADKEQEAWIENGFKEMYAYIWKRELFRRFLLTSQNSRKPSSDASGA
jgi:hypothetical protein